MMLAIEFADFGFGTVVGAVVAGSIALFLDQRRRTDEKKNRFLEERRLMYRNVAQAFDVMGEQVVLFGKFEPYFRRVEELDPEAQEIVERAYGLLKNILAKTKERYWMTALTSHCFASERQSRLRLRRWELYSRC